MLFHNIITRELCHLAKKLKIEKNKKKEKWNLFGTERKGFESTLLAGPRIELFSNNRAVVEGCLSVYEYNDNYLKLKTTSGAVILVGEAFDIVSFGEKTITVKGKISSLEFCV